MNNILDLDSASRIMGNNAEDYNSQSAHSPLHRKCSILAFFDFAAAFPSVVHDWICLVWEMRGFPVGIRYLFACIYFLNSAHASEGESLTFLFWYLSGVLQGCPASAFVFDVCLDPFLVAFEKVVADKGRGIIRACADDLGAALEHYKTFKYMYTVFEDAEKLAGLTLKPVKCIVVPTSEPFSEHIVNVITKWLCQNIPKWANFNLKSIGKYLCFYMRPDAASKQWIDPLSKFMMKCRDIGRCCAPASISVIFSTPMQFQFFCTRLS